uniref:Glycosyltransferase n=1 Tax=uncultured bacterium A1Q1_fos_1246 TaxID=1256545 RepID=L7VYQ2_9BACT|nr:glycosyltransferase [uncultured bacterium A1Q1_fos_1246]
MNLHMHGNNFTLDQTNDYRPPMGTDPVPAFYSEMTQVATVEEYSGVTVSVVIPAMNEAANLPHVLPQIPDWVHEVILVDGHSTDDTVAVAQRLRPDIRVVTQGGRGKGDALRCGFSAATGDMIVMLDADGSMDPKEIPHYIGALLSGADFAKGTRFVQGGHTHDMSFIRYCGNLGLTWLVRLLFGGKYSDLCYGYNAFWRAVLPALALDADGFEIETLMNVRALLSRCKITEVASIEHERIHGMSNLHALRDGWRVLKTIITERLQGKVGAQPGWPRDTGTGALPYLKPMPVRVERYQAVSVQKRGA